MGITLRDVGSEDAKTFIFSDVPEVQKFIKSLYPHSTYTVVESDDYSLDYDYIRDNSERPWL